MNEKISVHSKEAIKARMMQNAVRIWGLKNTSSIDPFVRLLMEAFSTELYRANNEVHTVNVRILERLAKLLTPSMYTYPQPAHAIAATVPMEAKESLSKNSEFYVKRQFSSSQKATADLQVNIPFTPVGNITLTKMNVDILFARNTCFTFDSNFNKIPFARTSETLPYNKIKIGIDVSMYYKDKLPEKLSIYCSNPTFAHIDFLYKLLPFVTISNHGKQLKVSSGLTYEESSDVSGYEEIFKAYTIQTKIEENIKNFYQEKFIEVSGIKEAIIDEVVPNDLMPFINNVDIKKHLSDKKYIWLDIEFPPQYSTDMLENFTFLLNAFPIYNRGWKSNESTLDIMGNTIPLVTQTGEYFLYVESVYDEFGNPYSEIPFSESAELKRGLYTVRTGGMERFTERDALDMISNVLELTRDEVAAFGILERDEVSKVLASMTQQMKILDRKIKSADQSVLQQLNYLIIELITDTKSIKANYWVSHCKLANNIRAGNELIMQKGAQNNISKNLKLLTETTGGNDEQKGANAIEAYKYALTTRDRLITIADIKSFCRLMLKDELKSVEVKRVTIISNKPKEGFIRAIQIEITPNDYNYLGKKYWDNQATALRNHIMFRGVDGVEYVVKINEENNE